MSDIRKYFNDGNQTNSPVTSTPALASAASKKRKRDSTANDSSTKRVRVDYNALMARPTARKTTEAKKKSETQTTDAPKPTNKQRRPRYMVPDLAPPSLFPSSADDAKEQVCLPLGLGRWSQTPDTADAGVIINVHGHVTVTGPPHLYTGTFEDGLSLVEYDTHTGTYDIPPGLAAHLYGIDALNPPDLDGTTLGEPLRAGPFCGQLRRGDTPHTPNQTVLCNHVIEKIHQRRYVTFEAVVGSGKTIMMVYIVHMLGRRALVSCTNTTLLQQAVEQGFNAFLPHLQCGILEGRNYAAVEGCDIVLCTPKTLAMDGHDPAFLKSFGIWAVDEVQSTGTREMLAASRNVNTRYRLGFTGTLRRNDDKTLMLPSILGDVVGTLSKYWDTYHLHTHFLRYDSEHGEQDGKLPLTYHKWGQYKGRIDMRSYKAQVVTHPKRAETICTQIHNDLQVPKRGKIIVYSAFVDHLQLMHSTLKDLHGIDSGVLWQKTNKGAKLAENLKHRVIFSTYGSGTAGINDPAIDTIYLIYPISRSANTVFEQCYGRIRPGEDKLVPLVRDWVDHCELYNMYYKRLRYMKNYNPLIKKHVHRL